MIPNSNQIQGKVIAVDCDEVLVNISPKWLLNLYEKFPNIKYLQRIYEMYEKENIQAIYEEALTRTSYNLNTFLNIPEKDALEIYNSNATFYDELPLTPMGEFLKSVSDKIDLYILTKITDRDAPVTQSKLDFLVKHFPNAKIYLVKEKESKSAVINANIIEYDIFIDDKGENLLDVIKYTLSEKKQILFPLLGYNKIFVPEFKMMEIMFGCNINFYTSVS